MPVNRLPTNDLQRALYERLDTILNVGVFDHVTESTDLPYATIGEWRVDNQDQKASWTAEVTGSIHVWSEYDGMKECSTLADQILQSLTTDELELQTFTNVGTWFVDFATAAEFAGDKPIRHGVLTVRWIVSN